jgi:hypothetical protein
MTAQSKVTYEDQRSYVQRYSFGIWNALGKIRILRIMTKTKSSLATG